MRKNTGTYSMQIWHGGESKTLYYITEATSHSDFEIIETFHDYEPAAARMTELLDQAAPGARPG